VDPLRRLLDLVLHLDKELNALAAQLGGGLYLLLFAIVFCETGLVVTPFLPGDSLLFAVGALSARAGSPIDPVVAGLVLWVAAVLGDAVNYAVGARLGPRVFSRPSSWLLNQEHLHRAQRFYERHGGKTVVIARFVPIIRTFAPFVAGVGQMRYARFALFNIGGAALWVTLLLGGGYAFADAPIVKDRFHLVILAIIGISVLPAVFEVWRARRDARREAVERTAALPSPGPTADPAPAGPTPPAAPGE
jgi:membrane-associated protein